jgi:hypothetical protein
VLLGPIISRLFTCSNAKKKIKKKTKGACSSPISMVFSPSCCFPYAYFRGGAGSFPILLAKDFYAYGGWYLNKNQPTAQLAWGIYVNALVPFSSMQRQNMAVIVPANFVQVGFIFPGSDYHKSCSSV